jgi:hypothetical protein
MVLSKTLLTLTAPMLGVALLVSAPALAQNTANPPPTPKMLEGNTTGPNSGTPTRTLTSRPSTHGLTAGVSTDTPVGNLTSNPQK